MTLNTTKTVRELALEVPNATRVFERMKIDYCCGGGRNIAEACRVVGVRPDELSRLLDETTSRTEPTRAAICWLLLGYFVLGLVTGTSYTKEEPVKVSEPDFVIPRGEIHATAAD